MVDFDKITETKNEVIDRIKNIGLIRGIEIGSGIAVMLGACLINFLSSDDELMATGIVENYDPDIIEVDDAIVENIENNDNK